MASHNAASAATKKNNRVRYWMCGRCRHAWLKTFIPDEAAYRPVPVDLFGDQLWEPPKDSCPNCGSKYSIRSFLNVSLGKETDRTFFNLDPFSGESLPECET